MNSVNRIKEGVYVSRQGKLKIVSYREDGWIIIDSNLSKPHPIFRGRVFYVHESSPGFPIEDYQLKNCEYLGEL